jgi:hypothetical protein
MGPRSDGFAAADHWCVVLPPGNSWFLILHAGIQGDGEALGVARLYLVGRDILHVVVTLSAVLTLGKSKPLGQILLVLLVVTLWTGGHNPFRDPTVIA